MIIRIIHACFIYHYFSFRDIFTVEKCPVSHMKNSSSEYFQNLLLNKNAPIRGKASFFNGLRSVLLHKTQIGPRVSYMAMATHSPVHGKSLQSKGAHLKAKPYV